MKIKERIEQIVKTHKHDYYIMVWDNSRDGETYDYGVYLSDLQNGFESLEEVEVLNNKLDEERKYTKNGSKCISLAYDGNRYRN